MNQGKRLYLHRYDTVAKHLLTVKDFHLLVRLKAFNTEQMNQAFFAFQRYEDASLRYTRIECHKGLTHYGLYDSVVVRESYSHLALFLAATDNSFMTTRLTSMKRQTICHPTEDIASELDSYSAIVRDYQRRFQRNANQLIRFYAGCRSYDEMLEKAAYAKLPSGKRHPHQYRLKQSALRQVHQKLKRFNLESCTSFNELFNMVHEAISGLSGIGEVMVYDTAHRIGTYLGLEPEFVYLHAGTRIGAVALGFDHRVSSIETGDLPAAFRRLKPSEIEDCLCIYKVVIQKIRNRR